ncbi:MAG: hypothetical protein LBN95_10305, partial [Prevotellaceae bacterium]|nr:hypothetical protein [Prevotellaceae bacterium]
MNDKLNTGKNIAIAGGLSIISFLSKKYLGDSFGRALSEQITSLATGIGGNLLSPEIERIEMLKFWELKNKNPDNLNHDLGKLSEQALNLTVKNGMKKAYEESKDKEDNYIGIGRKLTKEENSEIDAATAKYSLEVTDKDAIQVVDFDNRDNSLGKLIDKITKELPEISKTKPYREFFQNKFVPFFQIYFGELLKNPEYNKALIAYQRQVQNLMFDAIKEQKNNLPENIVNEIQKKINELTPEKLTKLFDEVNEKLDNISVQLAEIREIVKNNTKTLKIQTLRSSYLECENGKQIHSFDELKEYAQENNYLFFKYKEGCFHSIEDLTEDDFGYFTGEIKVNQFLIEKTIEELCKQNIGNAGDVQKKITVPDWTTDSAVWKKSTGKIIDVFKGIFPTQINNVITCGDGLNKNANNGIKNYVEIAFCIVEQIV